MARNERVLRELLTPLVRSGSTSIDSFSEDDMEGYIKGVLAFQVEKQVIEYVKIHPNASVQELYRLIPNGVPSGEEYVPDDDDDVDISGLSEYVQLLLTRYDDKNLDEEENDIMYFMIGNPEYAGVEAETLAYMKAHPEASLIQFYEDYIDTIIPKDYRKHLMEKMGWRDGSSEDKE